MLVYRSLLLPEYGSHFLSYSFPQSGCLPAPAEHPIPLENAVSILRQSGKEENDNGNLTDVSVEIPVLSYTEKVPVLREEYATIDYYELVHFMPVSLWKEIKGQIGDCLKMLTAFSPFT